MELRIAVSAVVFVLVAASAKQIIDIDNKKLADEWIAWSKWSGSNCRQHHPFSIGIVL